MLALPSLTTGSTGSSPRTPHSLPPPPATATCRSLPSSASPSAEDRLLRTIFDMLDADMDGHVSFSDVAHHLVKLGIADNSSEVVVQSVSHKPSGNTSLDYESFASLYKEGDEELAEAFAMYDVDGDGFISCEELQEVLVRMGFNEGHDEHFCYLILQSVDANSDGKIDYFEFRQMMSPKFAMA
ncbi:hypothetical protein L7F22_038251 [Adiantum nelumboides]|nr:hypothetical protein [Adiantum nelumboides]